MQFLIYIHCHVVIMLPLRCYSSSKRHRLYDQPAKIYPKSSLVISMLTCFIRSHGADDLLQGICGRSVPPEGAGSGGQRQLARGALLVAEAQEGLRRVPPSSFSYAVRLRPPSVFCVRSKAVSPFLPRQSTFWFQELHSQGPWLLPLRSAERGGARLPGSGGEDLRGFDTSFYLRYKAADLCFSVLFKYCILR